MIAALVAAALAAAPLPDSRTAEAPPAEAPPADPPPAEPSALPLPAPDPRKARPPAERFGTTGFRAQLPANGGGVSTRVALVQDFDGPFIGEATLRGHYAWQAFSVAVEVAGAAGASPLWSGAGVGNVVVDARGRFGRGSTHAIGLRGIFPAAGNRAVSFWGTVPEATVPVGGIALVYEGAAPRVVWHAHLGLHVTGWTYYSGWDFIDAALLVATVQPVAERWEVVAEMEALTSPSPLHVRGLVRRDLGAKWTADVGLAIPFAVFFADPTLQLLARLERRW